MRISIIFTFFLNLVTAYGHGGGEAEIEVGPEFGVLEIKKDLSFKLSSQAIKRFGIGTQKILKSYELPKDALVTFLDQKVIFKVEGDFYKPIKVIDTKRSDLNAGDSVVVKGSGFLRMIMAQLGSEKLENEDKEDHDDHKGHNEEHKDEHPEEAHHD